ncbi:MAG: 4Fe-4S binding protein [Archaeoglobus sp.]|nr:4Fe-4S binding protein [Archaeoglobus sp.]
MNLLLVHDRNKCIGCYACIIACKLEHSSEESDDPGRIRIVHVGPKISGAKVQQHFKAIFCRHCLNAPCVKECPTNALKKTEDGRTVVDEELCIGCRICIEVCPFGAPQLGDDGKIRLCDICMPRIENGKLPACVSACVARCLQVRTIDELKTRRAKSRKF